MQSARRISTWAGGSEPAPAYWGLCFTAEEAGSTIQLIRSGTSTALVVELEYSRDGKVWTPYTIGETITLSDMGDKVYFAAGDGRNASMAYNNSNFHRFATTGVVAASGNIMSLLNHESPSKGIAPYCFTKLFFGCTALTAAPELPATTLAQSCYSQMFDGCTALTAAPELPARTLVLSCYRRMFSGCTALTAAPELPATTLAPSCYQQMFDRCISLSDIKVHFTTWGTQTNKWVADVATLGLFRCPAALPHTASDFTTSKIPPGWTVETF